LIFAAISVIFHFQRFWSITIQAHM